MLGCGSILRLLRYLTARLVILTGETNCIPHPRHMASLKYPQPLTQYQDKLSVMAYEKPLGW